MDPEQLKPADLDRYCFQLSLYMVPTVFLEFMHGIIKVKKNVMFYPAK